MVKEIAPFIPRGFHICPETEFKKGLTPWNKGKPVIADEASKAIKTLYGGSYE
jgi:hypothetical protein